MRNIRSYSFVFYGFFLPTLTSPCHPMPASPAAATFHKRSFVTYRIEAGTRNAIHHGCFCAHPLLSTLSLPLAPTSNATNTTLSCLFGAGKGKSAKYLLGVSSRIGVRFGSIRLAVFGRFGAEGGSDEVATCSRENP